MEVRIISPDMDADTDGDIAGDGDMVSDIYRQRITKRGGRPQTWGWDTAYKEDV